MHAVMKLFFFSVLLTTGDCLECETCRALKTCTGAKVLCGPKEDACGTTVAESPTKEISMTKGCIPSAACDLGVIQVTHDEEGPSRDITSCCAQTDCTPKVPQLPTLDKKPNGRSCLSCSSLEEECSEEPERVNCTGSETHCTSFNLVNGTTVVGTFKGCTTESSCKAMNSSNRSPVANFPIKNLVCQQIHGTQANPSSAIGVFQFPAILLLLLLLLKPLL